MFSRLINEIALLDLEPPTSISEFSFNYSDYALDIAIYNGKRTEWSPFRSVSIRVINKIGRPRSRSLIC